MRDQTAVIKSIVSTARSAITYSYARLSPTTPTDFTGRKTAKVSVWAKKGESTLYLNMDEFNNSLSLTLLREDEIRNLEKAAFAESVTDILKQLSGAGFKGNWVLKNRLKKIGVQGVDRLNFTNFVLGLDKAELEYWNARDDYALAFPNDVVCGIDSVPQEVMDARKFLTK